MKKQNYKESKLILSEIKKANNILLNCHRSPDPDSVGSALSMKRVLEKIGKMVEVVCPTERIDSTIDYLDGYENIKNIDFAKYDYSGFDLLITLDSSSWIMVTDNPSIEIYKLPIIVIDHHETNDRYGKINLADKSRIATGEILFRVYEDWGVKLDKKAADCLMAAIIGDSGAFRFPGVDSKTFQVAEKLMKLGADKDKAIHNIYRSEDFNMLKFWAEVLGRLEFDRENRFIWSAVPYDVYNKYQKLIGAREISASQFAQIVEDTDFGFVAVESEEGQLSVSFRSRTGFNTSEIALELGGGGHIYASGARIEAPFDQAVETVLKSARKFAKEAQKNTS